MKAALLIQYVQNSYSEYVVPFLLFFRKLLFLKIKNSEHLIQY
jgi:hypothetical protein